MNKTFKISFSTHPALLSFPSKFQPIPDILQKATAKIEAFGSPWFTGALSKVILRVAVKQQQFEEALQEELRAREMQTLEKNLNSSFDREMKIYLEP